ncbi:MAG: ArsR family transcriptional regulator [Candidatus Heimdallarchaeota archaeon]|nr:MAG: ArsR family transcriptional regulator [Candidatus Heimdallarchaeota archaeon]
MNEKEFFALISNETRREILRSIAHEPKYLFQLSQELGKSQQALQRHLQCLLEKEWIIQDQLVEGTKGPARKLYRIAKNLSVRITLSQHSFDFDVFEISIGESDVQDEIPQDHIQSLSKDLPIILSQAFDERKIDFGEKIRKLDSLLEQLGSLETFLLSRKLSITGELNEEISVKLEGDAHRKDRELAYTIYSSSAPISIDLIQKEIKGRRTDILNSLKRLHEKNLLPENGLTLMRNLESTLKTSTD